MQSTIVEIDFNQMSMLPFVHVLHKLSPADVHGRVHVYAFLHLSHLILSFCELWRVLEECLIIYLSDDILLSSAMLYDSRNLKPFLAIRKHALNLSDWFRFEIEYCTLGNGKIINFQEDNMENDVPKSSQKPCFCVYQRVRI